MKPIELTVEQELEIERFFKGYSAKARKLVEDCKEYQMALRAGKVTMALEIAAVEVLGELYGARKEQFKKILRPYFPDYR
jgi:hypothetical protein